jgi:hypothetical protein
MAGRSLTPGEERLARHVFGSSINYRNVKIYEVRAGDYSMTPFGSIYFEQTSYEADFAGTNFNAPPNLAAAVLFVHEMVHVWQHSVGLSVVLRAGGARSVARKRLRAKGVKLWKMSLKQRRQMVDAEVYDNYQIDPADVDLLDFTLEEQGDIIADYFANTMWSRPAPVVVTDYERILQNFLADPAYPRDPRRRFGRLRDIRAGIRSWER